MNALIMALALATGDGLYEEPTLPRSLASEVSIFEESELPRSMSTFVEPVKAPVELQFFVGGHFAITYVYGNADLVGLNFGGMFRVHILPWLGAEASIDVNWIEQGIIGVPIRFSALFYPPLEGTIHPYGVAGFGIAIYNNGIGSFGDFFFGGGAEFEIQKNMMLDASIRFNFITDNFGGGGLDFLEFSVGILFKLGN